MVIPYGQSNAFCLIGVNFFYLHTILKWAGISGSIRLLQLSLTGVIGIFAFLPGIYESLYWLSSSINYLFPVLVFVLMAFLFFKKLDTVSIFSSTLFAFLFMGVATFNELVSIVALAILSFCFAFFPAFQSGILKKELLIASAGIVLGLMILLFSPGNWTRLSESHHEMSSIKSNHFYGLGAKYLAPVKKCGLQSIFSGIWLLNLYFKGKKECRFCY